MSERRFSRPAVLAVTAVALFGLALSPTWAGTYTGKWEGKTKQGRDISFVVNSKNKVTKMTVEWKIPLENCSGSVEAETSSKFKPPLKVRDGKFKATMGKVKVSGTFKSAAKATGKLTAEYSDPVTGCSGSISRKWSATKDD